MKNKENKIDWGNFIKKAKVWLKRIVMLFLNPRFLLCFGIGWMITNGWAYILFGLGTWLRIPWMIAVGGGYLALLWIPFTPEKIITATIALILMKLFFPNDKKTLGLLKEIRDKARRKKKEKQETGENEGEQNGNNT